MSRTRTISIITMFVTFLFVSIMQAQTAVTTEPVTTEPVMESDLPAGAFTYGLRVGEDFAEEQLDVLIPVYMHGDCGALMLNPRAAYNDEDEKELNLGVVYRRLLPERNVILGGNLFYDSRWPESGAQFDQVGVGVEILTPWVDARANYYLPEDKTRVVDTSEQVSEVGRAYHTDYNQWAEGNTIYERRYTTTTTTFLREYYELIEGTLEGWDAEIGVRLPMPWESVETRIFGGYYHFDPNIDTETVEGWKARLEVRALPAFLFDAEVFENDLLYGVDYTAGVRVQVPFNIGNAFEGGNPFEGFTEAFTPAAGDFRRRLTSDQVMRDAHVQLRRVVEETLTTFEERFVTDTTAPLYTGIIFVDDSNVSGIEDGSLPFPFDTIAEGLAAAPAGRLVFVFDGNYNESVQIVRDVMLIGEGFGLGGGAGFGNGVHPVVVGQGNTAQGATIRVRGAAGANNVIIKGFDIQNTGFFGPPGGGGIPGALAGIIDDATAVLAGNTTTFEFGGNIVRNTPLGVVQWHLNAPGFTSDFNGNTFIGNGAALTTIAIDSTGGARIRNNTMTGNLAGIITGAGRIASPTPVAVGHEITFNTIAGGGIDTFVNPFLAGLTLPWLTTPPQLPPVGGIGILGVTGGQMASSHVIANNQVSGHLVGLAGIEFLGATATYGILDNQFTDNLLGTALVAADGAVLNFTMERNVYDGGLLSGLVRPFVPAGITIPDMDLMGVFVGSVSLGGTPSVVNGTIANNQIVDQLIGIGSLGAGPNAVVNLGIDQNYLRGSGLGVLGNIPAGNIAAFLAANPGVQNVLNNLGIAPVPTLIAQNSGILGIGLGSIMGAQGNYWVNGNTIDNFALSTAAAAWLTGSINLTLTGNTSNANGTWWAGPASSIAPLTVAGNNFAFTQFVP